MRYYLLDDEEGVLLTLENIISTRMDGDVVGYSTSPVLAQKEAVALQPDVVVVDFLMKEMDGLAFIKGVKDELPQTRFIMLSKVNDKAMVGSAYEVGVQFFISKPINLIEIEKVLGNVEEQIKMNRLLSSIKGMVAGTDGEIAGAKEAKAPKNEAALKAIRTFLGMLGILQEKGTGDIMEICEILMGSGDGYSKKALQLAAKAKGDSEKNVEQRVRRAAKKALSYVAYIGNKEFDNEIFTVYGDYCFDFIALREEMDFLKDGKGSGGKVNLHKFFDGLLLYGQKF